MIQITKALPQADIKAYEVYALVGGDDNGGPEAFAALVDAFYEGIERDPIIRPMYPSDLGEAREHLTLFLIQYFGGPTAYNERRGHPRLRMRHIPFSIGEAESDAWLRNMNAAIEAVSAFAPVADLMRSYFQNTAQFLQNR